MAESTNSSDICRFCLRLGSSKMHLLSDETLQTIAACFSLQILINDYLPKQVCDDCHYKIILLREFQKIVCENEKLLYESLKKGCKKLNKLYWNFQSTKIKEEEEIISNLNGHTVTLKSEEANTKGIDSSRDFDERNDLKDDYDKTIDSKADIDLEKGSQNILNHAHTESLLIFKCLTCFDTFESQKLLLSHYKTGHYEKTNENDLKATFKIETIQGSYIYKCNACSRVYDNKKSINRHIATGHSDARPFLCKLCGRTYKTASEIVRHGRAHNGAKLFCSHQCGYSTVYHGALKEHERRHNASEFKYKCEKCDKGFHVKTWYLQHQNIHTGLKPFVCDVCGAAFHMEKYLTKHKSSKHPQTSSQKRYVCVHCSVPCDSMNALTKHLKEHGMNTEKKFLCDLCGKILSNGEQLRLHKRMHLGVKPYSCSTCNKSFAKKFNLQLHERSHTGEKAHGCQRCGKRYGQRSTLLRHIARHHSESEKLKRPKCIKTFSEEDQLPNQKLICT